MAGGQRYKGEVIHTTPSHREKSWLCTGYRKSSHIVGEILVQIITKANGLKIDLRTSLQHRKQLKTKNFGIVYLGGEKLLYLQLGAAAIIYTGGYAAPVVIQSLGKMTPALGF